MDIVLSGAFLTRPGQNYAHYWPSMDNLEGKLVYLLVVKTSILNFRILDSTS